MSDYCLREALLPLKESSKAAIADAMCADLSTEKQYLHIKRSVEDELQIVLSSVIARNEGALVLVCGNVGDGKSHLISILLQKNPEYSKALTIYNDATESSSPELSNIDELKKILRPYSDANISTSTQKSVLAINLGTLNNFLVDDAEQEFSQLTDFVRDQKILDAGSVCIEKKHGSSCFQSVNLCDHHLFRLEKDGPVSVLIEEAMEKVVSNERYDNPFRDAYKNSCLQCPANCPIRINFELLEQETVRKKISSLLIQSVIKHHHIISIRALYSFVFDLIVPSSFDGLNREEICEWVTNNPQSSETYIHNLIPNYLFEHSEISKIFEHLHYLDPALKRGPDLDEEIIRLVTREDMSEIIHRFDSYSSVADILMQHIGAPTSSDYDLLVSTYVRLSALANAAADNISFEDICYSEYTKLLYGWFCGDRSSMKKIYKLVLRALMLWAGKTVKGEILIESQWLIAA